MASACISTNCVNEIARAPIRPTYLNLYKWPESDAEFIKSVVSSRINNQYNGNIECSHPSNPTVLDSISYRQLYLRSYPFSKEESVCEKIVLKYYGIKRKARNTGDNSSGAQSRSTRENINGIRKAKEISCAALYSIFRRLLSCTVKVDVVD
ncbi:uncharacterized protein [Nicotiana tomentosiformis]|uniref:uncharacterized protein n=1 Tax=Nicotiana tomentosiformis TaxID=4098 RepID=UPI00051BB1F0